MSSGCTLTVKFTLSSAETALIMTSSGRSTIALTNASDDYVRTLSRHQMIPSMSRPANPSSPQYLLNRLRISQETSV
jgi:hypothetical protein